MTITVTDIGGTTGVAATIVKSSVIIPAGSTIFVLVYEFSQAANVPGAQSVTDSVSNTYVCDVIKDNAHGSQAQLFRSSTGTALSTGSITYTAFNAGNGSAMAIFYATGLAASPYDSAVTNSSLNGSGSPASVTSGTPSQAGDLFIEFAGWQAATGGGFTLDTGNGWANPPPTTQTANLGGQSYNVAGGYQVNAGTGTKTVNPTLTSPNSGAFIVAGYKLGAVVGSSAIAGTGSVSASPTTLKTVASQAVTGTATVSLDATVQKVVTQAIVGTTTVGASATALKSVVQNVPVTGTVSVSAKLVASVSPAISAGAAVSVNVSVIHQASAAIGVTATVTETISDPASANNSMGEFVSEGVAVSYNPNYVPASPLGATNPCLQNVVPSYLYEQYQDDDDLQAFVAAYNTITQQYVSWLNDYTLPVYTNPLITGDMLDWIARGLYGVERPSLSAGSNVVAGPYNTNVLNYLTYNGRRTLRTAVYTPVDDDLFKRILTWKLYKGDGKVMTVPWLKRRVYRFLFGPNGTDVNCGDTSGISVTFEDGTGIVITVITEATTSDARVPLYNAFRFNQVNFDVAATLTVTTQSIQTYTHGNGIRITLLDNPPNAAIFQEAVEQGILGLPFQFDFEVSI